MGWKVLEGFSIRPSMCDRLHQSGCRHGYVDRPAATAKWIDPPHGFVDRPAATAKWKDPPPRLSGQTRRHGYVDRPATTAMWTDPPPRLSGQTRRHGYVDRPAAPVRAAQCVANGSTDVLRTERSIFEADSFKLSSRRMATVPECCGTDGPYSTRRHPGNMALHLSTRRSTACSSQSQADRRSSTSAYYRRSLPMSVGLVFALNAWSFRGAENDIFRSLCADIPSQKQPASSSTACRKSS
jgi:hypothetical protein